MCSWSSGGSVLDAMEFVKLQNGKELAVRFMNRATTLTGLLVEKAEALGRMPTIQDVRDDKGMPHPNVFATEFSSFEKAIEAAEYEWRRRYPEGRTVKKMGRKSTYTKEGVLELLRKKAEELERIPTARELADDPNIPSVTVFKRLFGGVKAALAALMAEDIDLPEDFELPDELETEEPSEAPVSVEVLEEQQDMPVPAEAKVKIEAPKDGARKRINIVVRIEISFPDENDSA